MKVVLTILLITGSFVLHAQDNKIVKYYDTLFKTVAKENAAYYYEFADRDSFYSVTAYYYPSKKLYSKFICVDTNINSSLGLATRYYESGKLKDSIFIYPKGRMIYEYHFYENGNKKKASIYGKEWGTFDTWAFYESGKLWAHVYKKNSPDKIENDVFDEEGQSIPNYIYERPADFTGGIRGWLLYLERNLNRDLPIRNGALPGKYTVYVVFIINKDGRVTDVAAENDPGYGTKEEAERVIRNGPKWEPAVQLNNPVKYRHKQGITFVVSQ